jgi:mono/diheme cytochrome c family protein
MDKTKIISLVALLVLVIALPVYGFMEQDRMQQAKVALDDLYMMDGIEIYVQNCAGCHGNAGEGVGMIPGLNREALIEARSDLLFKSIARATHGRAMASWHIDEGGILSDYQLNEVVTMIQKADWMVVAQVAAVRGASQPFVAAGEGGVAFMNVEDIDDPHHCATCHEEPEMHADQFGINCARCHSATAWTPAVLTSHIFLMDHGGEGEVSCQTCHPVKYGVYDCYACHDNHQYEEMKEVHLAEDIKEFDNCAICHPTGVEGEAGRLMDENPGLKYPLSLEEKASLVKDASLLKIQPSTVEGIKP